MNNKKNITIKTKFILMICLTSILVTILGSYGAISLSNVNRTFKQTLVEGDKIISDSMKVVKNVIGVRLSAFSTDFFIIDGKYQEAKDNLGRAQENAIKSLDEYKSIVTKEDTEIIKLVDEMIEVINRYIKSVDNYVDLRQQGKKEEALEADSDATPDGKNIEALSFKITNLAFSSFTQKLGVVSKKVVVVLITSVILVLLTILFIILYGTRLFKSILNPIEHINKAMNEIIRGNLNVNLKTNRTDEMGLLSNNLSDVCDTIRAITNDIKDLSTNSHQGNLTYRIDINKYRGEFREVTDGINNSIDTFVIDMNYIADSLKQIEEGNFNVNIKNLSGDKINTSNNLKSIQKTIRNISLEINELTNAAIAGNLEYVINSDKYNGEWKDTINGLNKFVESIVIPIKETQNALNQFALGNFGHRIVNDYKGEFNEIKKTVNYTAETVGSYISEISDILNKMANKNFDVSIDRNYLGDFKNIQESVNLIVANLNVLTKGIITSAERVSSGSRQISESSISLAEGATEQSESVERLDFVIKEISGQTRDNAKSSEKANELAVRTREDASKGKEQMDTMLSAMEQINTASTSISKIIKVIEDIAFQTNILALNAAVEAARAGEHGKGFAVVAEEVRNLAVRSQQAAKETTDLIRSSVDKVNEGSKIADSTSNTLTSIVAGIEEIAKLVDDCAVSSKTQEVSINDILTSISSIASVTQANTATSEESAAASEELSSQAEIFYASVSDFKLRGEKSPNGTGIKKETKKVNTNRSFKDNKQEKQVVKEQDIDLDGLQDFGKY